MLFMLSIPNLFMHVPEFLSLSLTHHNLLFNPPNIA